MIKIPYLGHGLGLRPEHYQAVLQTLPPVDWFEVISENFMGEGGNPRRVLHAVREHYPVVLHGVSMSLGSVSPLDQNYLKRLKQLIKEVEPAWVSDHLCWSALGSHTVHDLWPLPYTEEALTLLIARVSQVQEFLGRQILVENVSSYVTFCQSTMSEWEFLTALAQGADCGLLLDINNIYVTHRNHGFDPQVFVDGIPAVRVGQFHLAGHSDMGTHVLDTHDHPICDAVWDLYRYALRRFGHVSALVEWDDNMPPLADLVGCVAQAREIAREFTIHPRDLSPALHSA